MGRLRAWDVCPACTCVYPAGGRCAACARALAPPPRAVVPAPSPPPERAPIEALRIEAPDPLAQIRPPRIAMYLIGVGVGVVAVLVLAAINA
jgi:hypothetical protein